MERETVADPAAWFAGPNAENADAFKPLIAQILDDYYFWRRNYFPEDGQLIGSAQKREHEPFWDEFRDRLAELLARLKADYPFYSPRYAAHMLSEQSLAAIAGYFAGMLYNPNNVTHEAAPVTVRLELEAGRMLSTMLGYGEDSWAHLTSGGTVANLEALWAARHVRYLPLLTRDLAKAFSVPADEEEWLNKTPLEAMRAFDETFRACVAKGAPIAEVVEAYLSSPYNPAVRGIGAVWNSIGGEGVVIVSEACHYSLSKVADLLGIGRGNLVSVPVDSGFRMRVDALAEILEQLDRREAHVLAVVATLGTTEEGSLDPLDEIATLRRRRKEEKRPVWWLHADAAYGGYLRTLIVPERAGLGEPQTDVRVGGEVRTIRLDLPVGAPCDALQALPEADSITVDPHKLGYVPYPCGAICFRSNLVKPILRQDTPYLAEDFRDTEAESRSDAIGPYIVEGSKPGAAAAAVWLHHSLIPLTSSGLGVVIREGVRNASELHALLSNFSDWSPGRSVIAIPLTTPQSNIVCFAFRPATGAGLSDINRLNRLVYERFTIPREAERHIYDQRFFVSRTFLTAHRYSPQTLGCFLDALGVSAEEYEKEGVFVLRSTLMNPWYGAAKARGRYYLSEMVEDLFAAAEEAWAQIGSGQA
ncbi:MAG: hypothetical protein D6724_01815 [Armatimonadetes bacterium]|nr:MAG: hypothetical protein D6724_01815 [Armatimonadota bacterium]